MNKKGFTLVELMITVVIIVLLSIFITPKVKNMINESKEKAYDSFVETIEDSANSYTYLNISTIDSLITTNGYADVTILVLQQGGLLATDLKNPLTNELLSTSDYVRITKTDNQYNYEYIGG